MDFNRGFACDREGEKTESFDLVLLIVLSSSATYTLLFFCGGWQAGALTPEVHWKIFSPIWQMKVICPGCFTDYRADLQVTFLSTLQGKEQHADR